MLGETANIRSKNIPYFQIFIIPDRLPYYNNEGAIQKWEEFSLHNAQKYLALSHDDINLMAHTPTKTLLFVIHLPETPWEVGDRKSYNTYYQAYTDLQVEESPIVYGNFANTVIYNDYEDFINKVAHYVLFQG